MATLQEQLLTPENAPHLIADTKALVDSELASKGITAAPLKGAYKAVTAFAPGYYDEVITAILPGVVYQLEPYWADFLTSGSADFGDYLAKRGGEASESLLAVTDDMAENSGRAAVVRAYRLVRGGASKNIEAALPALGALVQKYAG
ncbi:MAG TPA: hypothetical protein VHT26_04295 [Trebonia sp.]|nr:hypothetical protein [Trebonia sp.]